MSFIYLMVGIAVLLIFFLLGLLYLMTSDAKNRMKKKRNPVDFEKQLQLSLDKIHRFEKQHQELRQEIVALQKSELEKDKELAFEKAKVKKLQEKISQGKEWHEKEQTTIDKRGKEIHQLKSEVINVQEQYAREHAENLRLNSEVKEAQLKVESINEQRRLADFEKAQLVARTEAQRKEIVELKKQNLDLSKKKEDISWIAKTEYDRVKNLLEEKEKKL